MTRSTEKKQKTAQTAMRLHEARICVNCQTVYSRTVFSRCPSCASETFVSLVQLQEAAWSNQTKIKTDLKAMAPRFTEVTA